MENREVSKKKIKMKLEYSLKIEERMCKFHCKQTSKQGPDAFQDISNPVSTHDSPLQLAMPPTFQIQCDRIIIIKFS